MVSEPSGRCARYCYILVLLLSFSHFTIIFILLLLFILADILEQSRADARDIADNAAVTNGQTTKDDIARLIHLFKEPMAQRHWTDLYSVLSRAELDARKSGGEYAVAANPLASLAEIYNDYDQFLPQNLMVEYVIQSPGSRSVKKFPYSASSPEYSYLATHTHEIEPSNLSRRNIVRGPDWIKSQWGEVRKNLHQMFLCSTTVPGRTNLIWMNGDLIRRIVVGHMQLRGGILAVTQLSGSSKQ